MVTPKWDNLDDFVSPDDFAQRVAFALQSGQSLPVVGIFDEPYLNADIGEYEMDTSDPRFTAKASALAGISRGDTVTIDGALYDVMGYPQPDGTGFAVVKLSKVNA